MLMINGGGEGSHLHPLEGGGGGENELKAKVYIT
jgi:hypothetical protein